MNRLKKIAANEENEEKSDISFDEVNIKNIMDRVSGNIEDIKSNYYSLLENLNALYNTYPGVYNELKVMVKLPTKNDIESLMQFEKDLKNAIKMLSDKNYINTII